MNAERHYIGERGRQYHEKKHVLSDAASAWVARLRAEKIGPFVKESDTVFEYGAGSGWNLIGLRCARRIAFDISEPIGSQEEGIEWVQTLGQLPEALADAVICHHTLEHLTHPVEALAEISRLLRPGGKLLLFVPFEKERRYRAFNASEPNHHLYSWNVQTLGNLVSECGFKIGSAGLGRFGYDRFAATWSSRLGTGEIGFRLIRMLVHVVKPASEVRVVATRP